VATPYPAAQYPAAQYLAAQGNRRRRKEFHIPCARSGKTPQKREESGLWRCLNPLFRNAILAKPPGNRSGRRIGAPL